MISIEVTGNIDALTSTEHQQLGSLLKRLGFEVEIGGDTENVQLSIEVPASVRIDNEISAAHTPGVSRDELLDNLHDAVSQMDDATLSTFISAAQSSLQGRKTD